ncbi:Hyaluronan mediated motility receptor-like protein [Hirschfeldia incana]|nr:Hyaluronan mediated motility receptor-like protein [Hirschfeldia incana]KAJ0266283.1 Hyaluronan mediated motility receptor-like protein [Hirschfeldia incana]
MTRSWVLLFVLMFIVLTSQLEWKEQLENEIEASRHPLIQSDKEQHHIPHGKESVQEKKILSQENKIQRLNEQVQDLRRQLVQCRNENQVELVTELDQLPLSGV